MASALTAKAPDLIKHMADVEEVVASVAIRHSIMASVKVVEEENINGCCF